jgi:RNA polymerase-associated protein LEO1
MPNFVKVDPKPFHAETYMGPEHDDEESQHTASLRERSMTIKLKVENTVRWRWVKDENGQYVRQRTLRPGPFRILNTILQRRQSNSRIIRWSDGSLSLMLGKELFDINQSIDTSGAVPRQAFGSQTTAPSQSDPSPSQSQSSGTKSQGLTYLVAQHKRSQVLQAEALITGYMTLTPTGMQSETHRMLVRAVGQKHNKVARLRMAPDPTTDPEREKMELMKQSAKKSKKKADLDDGLGGGRRKRTGYSRKRSGHDVWSDDDDEDGQPAFAASDEEEDDGMGSAAGGSPRKGSRKLPEDEKKGAGEYQEDDFVVADSTDDEAGAEGHKRKRRDGDEEMEEDPLDKLDAKIREQEDENKRRREQPSAREGGADDAETEEGEDEEMEVESEEDEDEEFKVRHAGGAGGRKKRAIQFDDEDE